MITVKNRRAFLWNYVFVSDAFHNPDFNRQWAKEYKVRVVHLEKTSSFHKSVYIGKARPQNWLVRTGHLGVYKLISTDIRLELRSVALFLGIDDSFGDVCPPANKFFLQSVAGQNFCHTQVKN